MKIGLLGNSDVCYNSLNYFMDCIEEALHSRGIHTQRITDAANINHTQDGPWSAIIGINQYQPAARTQDGSYVLDSFQCLVFNILVDPPYYHHGKLESHMDNLTLYLLDQGHVEYCKRYPQWTRGHTVLHHRFAILPRYCRSAYVQYASFQCLAESQI